MFLCRDIPKCKIGSFKQSQTKNITNNRNSCHLFKNFIDSGWLHEIIASKNSAKQYEQWRFMF